MLEDCLIESRPTARTRKPTTLAISVFVHGTLAVALIVFPLLQTQLLPQVALLQPLRPPAAYGRAVELVPVSRPKGSPASSVSPESKPLTVPIDIPKTIAILDEAPSDGIVGLVPSTGGGNGAPGSPFGGFEFGDVKAPVPPPRPPAPPPPPPAPPAAAPAEVPKAPLKVGTLEPSKLVHMVQPTYPRLASITGVEGAVVLEAVITRDGAVDSKRLKVVSGHVLLVPSAVEAVQQWRYQPTVMNGEPIEILATIRVNFTLKR